MLALHVAVVRGEDEVGVVELARAAYGGDDARHAVVGGEQRRAPGAGVPPDRPDVGGGQGVRMPAKEARLARHVGLVEARAAREWRAREGAAMARRRTHEPVGSLLDR